MPGAAVVGERGLQRGHFRTVDELAMREHAGNRLIDRCAEPAALRDDVDERYGFWTQVLVHGALRGFLQGFLAGIANGTCRDR